MNRVVVVKERKRWGQLEELELVKTRGDAVVIHLFAPIEGRGINNFR